ncbi:nucleotide excision repair endonuclease (plasmid) [Bacillus mycoides]|nr:nucleotide excision repair endonuclease [Bacillus mycoides]
MKEHTKTIKSKVEYILRKYPATRINDKLLVSMYWKHFDSISTIDDCVMATSSETITRHKRKLNEQGKYTVTLREREQILAEEHRKNIERREKMADNLYDDGMIAVQMPSVRKSVFVEQIRSDLRPIDDLKEVPGIYVFYDKFSNPLYVGISANLYARTVSHVSRISSNQRLAHLLHLNVAHRIDFMYVNSVSHREIYESYLIKTLRPYCNIGKTTETRRHAGEDITKGYRKHIRSA